MMDTQKIINQLDEIYGLGKGMGIYMNIMPGILADFDRMLKKSKGAALTEEYRLEDEKAVLYATGKRSANGQTDIEVNVRGIFKE
jgi:hypothetical protein